jgi:hypothetical protein
MLIDFYKNNLMTQISYDLLLQDHMLIILLSANETQHKLNLPM